MLDTRASAAIARLAESVLSVGPLVAALGGAVRVVPVAGDGSEPAGWSAADQDAVAPLLHRLARGVGVGGLEPAADRPEGLQVFERVVSERLALADAAAAGRAARDLPADVDRIAAETAGAGFDAFFHKRVVRSFDGVPLQTYSAGSGGQAVVFIPACGMPAALTETWLRHLARDRLVLTWESRGLFGAFDGPAEHEVDCAAQAADLFAVLDHYGVPAAHVIGLCGGAVIGLAAAADRPERISSLSLWHGAYEFGDGHGPKTRFHHDLVELMAVAAQSRGAARSVQNMICRMALSSAPAGLEHHVLYPYANAELFYRYCRLNGTLARTDVEPYLGKVGQPVLVVTSEDDETAHPQGSTMVARALPDARLLIAPHGDHASLFRADEALIRVAADFIEDGAGG